MRGIIALDGGGSKTECVLVDETGIVISQIILNCSNPNDVGMDNSFEVVKEGISTLLKVAEKKNIEIINIFLGIAGIEFGNSRDILLDKLHNEFKDYNIDLSGDLLTTIEMTLEDNDGIVIISGTGFNMAFKNNNEITSVGGWGYLADDYLSGYDLGHDALIASSKCRDKSGEYTILLELLEKYFSNNLWYAMKEIYEGKVKTVASLSKIVVKAYELNDKVARNIIDNRVKNLVNIIMEKSKDMVKPINIYLTGGIFTNNQFIVENMRKLLGDNYNLIISNNRAIYGATRLAFKTINKEITNNFIDNFKKSYKENI